jgi:hypothetical protein
MFKFLIFVFTLATVSVMAQIPPSPDIIDPSHADLRGLNQNGSMVSIRLEPSRPISFYVVGKEEAEVDLSQLQVVVRNLSKGDGRILSSHQEGNRYVIDEPLDLEQPTDLEVTAKTPIKAETFHFKISNVPH